MSSRIVVAWAASGLLLLTAAAGEAWGQFRGRRRADVPPIIEKRSYVTDYRTISECLERAARDRGFSMVSSGGGSAWDCMAFQQRAKELFAVVADEQKFSFLGQDVKAPFCYVGGALDQRELSGLRRIKLDLDTGELKGPDGVDLQGLRIVSVSWSFTLRNKAGVEVHRIHVTREFPDQRVNAYIASQRKDGRAECQELLASLESKLKLASKLKEARKRRHPDLQPKEPIRGKSRI